MTTFAIQIPLAVAAAVAIVWLAIRFAALIKADGYGFRSSSGLPRDWAPPETPSMPYNVKPHF